MGEHSYNEMVDLANQAAKAYYETKTEIMSNKEWDALYDEIKKLEEDTGIIRPDSPTQRVGSDGIDNAKGKKEKHEYPALSLPKSKDVNDLIKWAGDRAIVLSWKLDGLTLVVTYDNGEVSKICTRGNGSIGTNITFLKDAIGGIPKRIAYTGHLVVRGEALISYEDFNRINADLSDEEVYANARNLASGTLTLDDPEEVKRRGIQLVAFTLVHCDSDVAYISNGKTFNLHNHLERMWYLEYLGFNIVPMAATTAAELSTWIDSFTNQVSAYEFPVDGLVICYNDWDYAQSGNLTGHHSTTGGYAFKWKDETAETVIRDIEWSDSRTGLFNPVAVFDPVSLCGTVVSRASLFNLSYVNEKDLKIGDHVTVYKANMIIPCIDENLNRQKFALNADPAEIFKRYNIPVICPHCGNPLSMHATDNAVVVRCEDPRCPAKLIGRLTHFCERDCMNIMDLSKKKLQQLIDFGIIHNIPELLYLPLVYKQNRDIPFEKDGQTVFLSNQDGWGKESVAKLAKGIDDARKRATFVNFLHAMGIPNVGKGQAKLLAPVVVNWKRENKMDADTEVTLVDILKEMVKSGYDFTQIDGFGEVIANALTKWVKESLIDSCEDDRDPEVAVSLAFLEFIDSDADYVKDTTTSTINGLTFVVTGDVHIFKNRKEVEAKIEELGGKLSGSVSKKTSYLINNDITSTSGKNQKAKELGIPIITEEQFCDMIGMTY